MKLNELESMIRKQIDLYETTAKKAELNEMLLAIYLAETAGLDRVEGLTGDLDAAVYSLKDQYKISDEDFNNESERAYVMAESALEWAKNNNYGDNPTRVIWTARKGSLESAIAPYKPSKRNPTDVLLEFGKDNWLGISAKSTVKSQGVVPFANPGPPKYARAAAEASKESALKYLESKYKSLFGPHNVSDTTRDRFIKSLGYDANTKTFKNPKERTPEEVNFINDLYRLGVQPRKAIRDAMVQNSLEISQRQLKRIYRQDWMQSSKTNFPYFIVVTGRGTEKTGYSASVIDPLKSTLSRTLSRDDIIISDLDSEDSFKIYGVSPTGKETYLFKIRVKWEGRPFGSTIKLSGER
jgi:hypothetical protein